MILVPYGNFVKFLFVYSFESIILWFCKFLKLAILNFCTLARF